MSAITVELRQAGKTRAAMPRFDLVIPAQFLAGNDPVTVGDLLRLLVTQEIEAFHQRQTTQRVVPFLTAAQIDEGASRGKINPRPETPVTTVDVQAVLANVYQSFADGLFFLFVDDQQQENLAAPLTLQPNSRITLLRLIALAGG